MKKLLTVSSLVLCFFVFSGSTLANHHLQEFSKRTGNLPHLSYKHFHDEMDALDAMGSFSALAALHFIVSVYIEPEGLTDLDVSQTLKVVNLTPLEKESLSEKGEAILERHEKEFPVLLAERIFQQISGALSQDHSQGYSPDWIYAVHLLARTGMGAYRVSHRHVIEKELINGLARWGAIAEADALTPRARRQRQIASRVAEAYVRQRELISPPMRAHLDLLMDDRVQHSTPTVKEIFNEAEQWCSGRVQFQKESEKVFVDARLDAEAAFLVEYSQTALGAQTLRRLFELEARENLPPSIRLPVVRLLSREARNRILDRLELGNGNWESHGVADCVRAILGEQPLR